MQASHWHAFTFPEWPRHVLDSITVVWQEETLGIWKYTYTWGKFINSYFTNHDFILGTSLPKRLTFLYYIASLHDIYHKTIRRIDSAWPNYIKLYQIIIFQQYGFFRKFSGYHFPSSETFPQVVSPIAAEVHRMHRMPMSRWNVEHGARPKAVSGPIQWSSKKSSTKISGR